MTKAKTEDLLEFYKHRCERYESILDFVRQKCRHEPDMEFALRKVLKDFHGVRTMPLPGTPEYREKHGIPFD